MIKQTGFPVLTPEEVQNTSIGELSNITPFNISSSKEIPTGAKTSNEFGGKVTINGITIYGTRGRREEIINDILRALRGKNDRRFN